MSATCPPLSFDACSCDEPRELRIPAITVKQPFASLIVWGSKTIETRSSNINYRGPLVITSGKKVFDGPSFLNPSALDYYEQNVDSMPQGMAIGVVDLVDCRPMTSEDEEFALVPSVEGLYSWIFENPVLIRPFDAPGHLGIFYLPGNRIVVHTV
jgi:hypothetical protein